MAERKTTTDKSADEVSGADWKNHLNTIGLFIGTHGLAVFLVVFYTVYLYPKSEQERGEWIREISSIRQLLEPETRLLSGAQAESVLAIAKSSFLQQLDVEFQRAYSLDRPGVGAEVGSPTNRHFQLAFGQKCEYTEGSPTEGGVQGLIKDLRAVSTEYSRRKEIYNAQLIDRFDRVASRTEVIRYQLARLRTRGGTLDEIWQRAMARLRKDWVSVAKLVHNPSDYEELTEFNRFERNNPNFTTVAKSEPNLVAFLYSIQPQQEPITTMSSKLEQYIADELQANVHSQGTAPNL